MVGLLLVMPENCRWQIYLFIFFAGDILPGGTELASKKPVRVVSLLPSFEEECCTPT
jgi:hypothetical protein